MKYKPGDKVKYLYIVTMYRYGSKELHSYLLGAYSTKTKAEKAADKEREYRGGNKYYPEILEVQIDKSTDDHQKVILGLDHNSDFVNIPEDKNGK